MSAGRISQLIECSVCIEAFSLKEHLPKCLPCGHTFCLICIKSLNNHGSISCPNCKKSHLLPAEGVRGFITNHIITSVLDHSCRKCHGLVETKRCSHCSLQLCTPCLDQHIHNEFKPAVYASLEKNSTMLEQLHTHLPNFVDRLNKLFEICKEFCEKSKASLREMKNLDNLKYMKEKSLQYMKVLAELDDLISVSIDPDTPCVIHTKRPSSRYAASDSSKLIDQSVKPRKKKTVVYNMIPSLVFGSDWSGPAELKRPLATTVDEGSGDIYIGYGQNNRICVYDKDARFKLSFDVGSCPWDLCFIPEGYVIVTCGDHKIRIYDVTGKIKQTIGSKGKDLGEFDNPCGITTDMDGLLYVCDRNNHRLQVLDENGSVVRVIGTTGPFKLEDPCSVAVHPLTGQIYVVDGRRKQVNIYGHDGQFESSMGEEDIPGVYAQYVSFSNDGLLCISDPDNGCIHLVRDGSVTQKIGEKGSAPGQFDWPLGSVISSNGDIIVCDVSNHKVQIYSPK